MATTSPIAAGSTRRGAISAAVRPSRIPAADPHRRPKREELARRHVDWCAVAPARGQTVVGVARIDQRVGKPHTDTDQHNRSAEQENIGGAAVALLFFLGSRWLLVATPRRLIAN